MSEWPKILIEERINWSKIVTYRCYNPTGRPEITMIGEKDSIVETKKTERGSWRSESTLDWDSEPPTLSPKVNPQE